MAVLKDLVGQLDPAAPVSRCVVVSAGCTGRCIGIGKVLVASAGFRFNKNFSPNLNLLYAMYLRYFDPDTTPLASDYVSGREYMLEAHFKL